MTDLQVKGGQRCVRVLLVDDQQMMREGLRAILDRREGFEVVGEAGDGLSAAEAVRGLSPDIVLMDVAMKGMNGIDATRAIVREHPEVRVLALSSYADRRYVENMVQAGARGYVLKDAAGEELVRALEAVQAGQFFASPEITDCALSKSPATPLAPRERQVLQLLAEGLTSPQIAERLQISPRTVEAHRRNIMRKLHIRTIAELVKWAVREGITPLEH